MNKRHLILTVSIATSTLFYGCDVTNNSATSPSSQDPDAVIVDFPIAYIERPVPFGLENDNDVEPGLLSDDIFDPTAFRPGAKLFIKDRASLSAASRVITDEAFTIFPVDGSDPIVPDYDVRDLNVNPEGTKLAFSMRAPEIVGADDDEQPTWNIWEYDLETEALTRVIESDVIAEEGHDRFPVYVPDGSLIFSSTRQRTSKAELLNQSRPQYAYVTELDEDARAFTLHRIDEDRQDIDQISFGKGHDIYPTILDDGRVMYLRGDDTSNVNDDRMSLYTMNPDGSNATLEYGYHSPSSQDLEQQGALVNPLQLPDGRIMVTYRPRESSVLGGDLFAVDTTNYIDVTTPTSDNLGATGPAEESLTFGEVVIEDGSEGVATQQSPAGYFNSAFPLSDGTDRYLVSWMPCLVRGFRFDIYVRTIEDRDDEDVLINTRYQLINALGEFVNRDGDTLLEGQDAVEITADELVSLPCDIENFGNENIEPAEPQYGIWVYDPITQTQDPVVASNVIGTIYMEAVVFEPRTPPTIIPGVIQDEFTQSLAEENVGIIHIRSVYDLDGVDIATDGIAAMADPLRTPTDSRPIRFVRFYEEANMPNEDDYEIDADLVGGRFNNPSRSIIGYTQVHPDGSVMAKVPANVQFAMEFLDADGRRVQGGFNVRHRNWLTVRPGETRQCSGCHSAASTEPHGRRNAEPESANPGALAEAPFTNTSLNDLNGTPYLPPLIGETMAEYYVRSKSTDIAVTDDPLALSLNIVFTDEWTDPASGALAGEDINILLTDLLTDAPVRIEACETSWTSRCRSVIDFTNHIQPMWELSPRNVTNEDGSLVVDSEGVPIDVTCTICHSATITDDDGNTFSQIPAPNINDLQLDFSNVISPLDNNMVFLKGYDEFFAAGDPVLELDPETNTFVLKQVQQQDAAGNLLFEGTDDLTGLLVCAPLGTADVTFALDVNGANVPCLEQVLQDRYMNDRGANINDHFFEAFEPGGAHYRYLTPAELKLLSEWLDGGSQYYNEIFDVNVVDN